MRTAEYHKIKIRIGNKLKEKLKRASEHYGENYSRIARIALTKFRREQPDINYEMDGEGGCETLFIWKSEKDTGIRTIKNALNWYLDSLSYEPVKKIELPDHVKQEIYKLEVEGPIKMQEFMAEIQQETAELLKK